MSKDIDLTEILKNCPTGAQFYSYIFGEDTRFMGVSPHQGDARPIFIYGLSTVNYKKIKNNQKN